MGWAPVMDAANIEPGAPFGLPIGFCRTRCGLVVRIVLAREVPLGGTLARLASVATSRDKESADAALAHAQRLLRKVRRRRSQWLEDGDGLFRVWFDSVHEDGSHGRATASVLPALLPPRNRRDASHLKFIANAVADAAAMIARRNVALSGPPLLIAAACFSDPQDSGSHAGSTAAARPVVVKKGEAPELLDLFRKLSQREAAEAAAAAAAARFGAADGGAGGPDQTPVEAEEAELGVAALSLGAIENCAADMDARDWQTIIGRLESWTRTRVLHAETAAEETASIAASVCHEEIGKDGPFPSLNGGWLEMSRRLRGYFSGSTPSPSQSRRRIRLNPAIAAISSRTASTDRTPEPSRASWRPPIGRRLAETFTPASPESLSRRGLSCTAATRSETRTPRLERP